LNGRAVNRRRSWLAYSGGLDTLGHPQMGALPMRPIGCEVRENLPTADLPARGTIEEPPGPARQKAGRRARRQGDLIGGICAEEFRCANFVPSRVYRPMPSMSANTFLGHLDRAPAYPPSAPIRDREIEGPAADAVGRMAATGQGKRSGALRLTIYRPEPDNQRSRAVAANGMLGPSPHAPPRYA